MNKIAFFLGLLVISYSCSTDPQHADIPTKSVDIDSVKLVLSLQDEIPVDSIHVVKLKQPGLYLAQGFGRVDNAIRLVKLYPDRFEILDSIQTSQGIDVYRQPKIYYDEQTDWFAYSDVSSGTGDLAQTVTLVRVENNRFSHLFTYSKNASMIDVEDQIHQQYKWVEIKELELSRNKLVFETRFESGMENTNAPVKLKITDTVMFEFSKSRNKFILKGPINPDLKDQFWLNEGEYTFRL